MSCIFSLYDTINRFLFVGTFLFRTLLSPAHISRHAIVMQLPRGAIARVSPQWCVLFCIPDFMSYTSITKSERSLRR